MLVPLIGAIYWRRATTAGAIASMLLGCTTAVAFMVRDGLAANTPIYASLARSEEHTSELQSQSNLVCRLLLEKKKRTHPILWQDHTSELHSQSNLVRRLLL